MAYKISLLGSMKSLNKYRDNSGNSVEVLGMTGLKVCANNEIYFIDSEVLVGGEYDIALFQDKVRYFEFDDERVLQESKRREIFEVVIEVLKSNGLRPLLLK